MTGSGEDCKFKTIKMKIYEFCWPGNEIDWIFAPNKKEAKKFYLKHTGCGDLDNCKIKIIPKKEWGEHTTFDPNESEPDSAEDYNEDDYMCGYKIIGTFADYAKENDTIDIIATTEF